MGTSYYRSVTQWSQGEYAGANNDEDDLAIISSAVNVFGYASAAQPSDGYSNSGTALLPVTSSAFSLNGVLRRESQPDEYEFYTTGGTLSAAVKPITANYANADLQLELSDHAGVGKLQLRNAAEQLGEWRFTLGHNLQAASLLSRFHKLQAGHSPSSWQAWCPQCHAPLNDPEQACRACEGSQGRDRQGQGTGQARQA
jgi:hypothetical protein